MAIEQMEKQVRPALHQRVPRRRRQPASADPVRRQRCRRSCSAPKRSAPTSWRLCVRDGRHDHRRARRRRRENQLDVRAVLAGRARAFFAVKRAFDPAGLLNPGQGHSDAARAAPSTASMHVRARPAAASRAAALLMRPRLRPWTALVERVRAADADARRALRIRGGGTKDFYGEALRGELLDTRTLRRHRRATSRPSWSSPRAAARRWRSSRRCSPSTASACRSSRRTSAPARPSAAWSRPGSRARARQRRRGARLRARRDAAERPRRAAALRRPGHEERRRLRRLAPAGRLARHRWA